jgi:hypothetical protein
LTITDRVDFQWVRARRSGSIDKNEVDGFPSRFVFRPDFQHQLDRPILDGLLQHVTSLPTSMTRAPACTKHSATPKPGPLTPQVMSAVSPSSENAFVMSQAILS